MIDVRCPRCGDTVEILDKDQTTSFKEKEAKVLCTKCQTRIPDSAETKLKDAILGRRGEDETSKD